MKRLSIISVLILAGLNLVGQVIVVSTEAPGVVTVGEQFRVTWTVNDRGGTLEPPVFTDFYKLMGPQSSFSQSTQIVNGRVTSTIKNSFTYYLQATREGKFTIGPAKYLSKKDEYLSRPVTIEVIDAEEQARTESGRDAAQSNNTENQQSGAISSSDLYVRLLVNRTKVTMGEHITATLKIYSRIAISGIQEVNFPDFNGFLKTDLETEQLRALERENVNGQIYNTGVLQRFLIYPQKTGRLSIDPSTLTVLLQERSKSNDPFFGDFFSSFNTVPRVLATLPVEIEVSQLPSGAPDSFNGSVGSLSIMSEISNDTISVNEALTLRINISGNGNLKLSSAPELILSPDIELYDPKIESNLISSVTGTSGSKVFEYVLIPRHHGLYEIPQVEYSYYDPDRARYITLSTSEHKFYVRKGDEDNETTVFGANNKENVTYLGRDIRYIHTDNLKLKKKNSVIVSRSSFIILYVSTIILFIIIIVWRREHLKRNSDLLRVKNRKAAKVASSRLKTAGRFLGDNNDEAFFAELLKALWGYLSDKLSIPVSELNLTSSVSILSERGINDEVIALMKHVIESSEYSRYSPSGAKDFNRGIFDDAEKVIKMIENEI